MSDVTVRDAVFALLRELGLTTIFGNPGSTELPMFRAFPDDFRYVLALQESVALGMADGFAQATRGAAVVNLHSAVGTGHALGNLFTACRNCSPVIVIAGQQARSILPWRPFLYAEQAAEFPKPYVKYSVEPTRAEDVPAAIAEAWRIAMTPPTGPVFVSVPVDDWDRPAAYVAPGVPEKLAPPNLSAVAEALANAKNPAFVVGAQAARDGAWDAIVALAERHRARTFVAPMAAREAFPEDHSLFAGFLTAAREPIVAALAGHDLVLVLGAPVFTYHVEGSGPHLPDGSILFQITDDPVLAEAAAAGTSVIGNVREAAETLLAARVPERAAPAPLVRPPVPAPVPLTDAWLLSRLAALRPADSIIVEEAPSGRGPMHDFLPILRPDGFYTCASGGLGHALPAAVGVALARPHEKVIALIGDGSAMYAIQALWTAAQLRVPLSVIIVNNRRYEALVNFGRRFGLNRTIGTELDGLDFVGLAEAQGVSAERVENADTLDAALARSLAAAGPSLVEVMVA